MREGGGEGGGCGLRLGQGWGFGGGGGHWVLLLKFDNILPRRKLLLLYLMSVQSSIFDSFGWDVWWRVVGLIV